MARDGMVIITTKRKVIPVEDEYQYFPDASSERVMRNSHSVLDDSACIHHNSRKEDRRLLTDITDKLVDYNKPLMKKGKGANRHKVISKVVRTSVKPKSRPINRVKVKSSKPSPQPAADQGTGGYRRRRKLRVARSLSPAPVAITQPPPAQKRQERVVKKLHTAAVDHAIRRANDALDRYVKRELEMPEMPARKTAIVHSYAHLRKPGKTSNTPRPVSLSPPRPAPQAPRVSRKKREYDVDPILKQQRKGLELLSIRSKLAAIEEPSWPMETYKFLRVRATDARNRLDEHKTLMDRYLPPDYGPSNDVDYEVDRKYGELAYRMPELQGNLRRYTYGNPFATSSPTLSKAQSMPSIPLSSTPSRSTGGRTSAVEVPRPAMSDARRRAREVLCKTKRDPSYFN